MTLDTTITSFSIGVPGPKPTKKEELALAHKASMDTTLEKQAARQRVYFLIKFPGDFTNT